MEKQVKSKVKLQTIFLFNNSKLSDNSSGEVNKEK